MPEGSTQAIAAAVDRMVQLVLVTTTDPPSSCMSLTGSCVLNSISVVLPRPVMQAVTGVVHCNAEANAGFCRHRAMHHNKFAVPMPAAV